MKQKIIALTGARQTGKTTVAQLLAGKGWQVLGFRALVATEVAEAWRVDVRMLTDQHTQEWPIPALAFGNCSEPGFARWVADGGDSLTEPRSPGQVLREFAAWRQRADPAYFIRQVVRSISRTLGGGWPRVVVDDVTTPAQAEALRGVGAKVVRVHRPLLACDGVAGNVVPRLHAIEADADLLNDSGLQALAASAVECVEVL